MEQRGLTLIAVILIVAVAGCSDRKEAPKAAPLPEGAVSGMALERIGTIGDYPHIDGRIVVNVGAAGVLTVDGRAMNLDEFGEILLARADESRDDSPVGFVLRVGDVLHRAGARELTCIGTPPRRGPDAIARLVREARSRKVNPSIRLSGQVIGGIGERAPSLPPVARVTGRPASFILSQRAGDPEAPDLTERPPPPTAPK